MVAVDADIVAGFRRLWAQAGLATLVTGGLHWDQDGVPATTEVPYAVLRAKAEPEKITTATETYLDWWRVSVDVHTTTLRTEILRALAAVDRTQTVWPDTFGRCIEVKPDAHEASDHEQPAARDVYVLRAGWRLTIQQERERGW